jgi:hypothetical protein
MKIPCFRARRAYAGGAFATKRVLRGLTATCTYTLARAASPLFAQGASFKEFCEHPDNRQMMVQHQQKEIHQMQKASAKVGGL